MRTVYKISCIPLLLAACNPAPDFDSVPRIEYVGVTQTTVTDERGQKEDKIAVTLAFEDGEGDLGATADERGNPEFTEPYGPAGNYELVTVRKNADGSVTEFVYSQDKPKWMPILKTDNAKGPLKGKLDLNFTRSYANSTKMVEEKYKIRIKDRALHLSNQIETDFITVPGYPL
jgi:hypothetical protein